MKYAIAFAIGFCTFSAMASESVEAHLKQVEAQLKGILERQDRTELSKAPETEIIRRDYFASDQHDNFSIQLVEATSERIQSNIEDEWRNDRIRRLEDPKLSGAIPLITLITIKHDADMSISLDLALDFRIDAIKSKLRSLEALIGGDGRGFLTGDVETNLSLLRSFQARLSAAQKDAVFHKQMYDRLLRLSYTGAVAQAKNLAAELEMKKTAEGVTMWKLKCIEQQLQYQKAVEELKKAGPKNAQPLAFKHR